MPKKILIKKGMHQVLILSRLLCRNLYATKINRRKYFPFTHQIFPAVFSFKFYSDFIRTCGFIHYRTILQFSSNHGSFCRKSSNASCYRRNHFTFNGNNCNDKSRNRRERFSKNQKKHRKFHNIFHHFFSCALYNYAPIQQHSFKIAFSPGRIFQRSKNLSCNLLSRNSIHHYVQPFKRNSSRTWRFKNSNVFCCNCLRSKYCSRFSFHRNFKTQCNGCSAWNCNRTKYKRFSGTFNHQAKKTEFKSFKIRFSS